MNMNLGLGLRLKWQGIELVYENNRTFVDGMRLVAKAIVKARGRVSSDDLREVASKLKIAPDHCNAWGSITKGKIWKCIGRKKSELPSNHGREIRVWSFSEVAL